AECLPKYFGSSTNGLCSGNTLREATVHGVCEVVERDTRSFHLVEDRSTLLFDLPTPIARFAESLKENGMELWVRYFESELQLPVFAAYLCERSHYDPLYISGGYGCHLDKQIAVS